MVRASLAVVAATAAVAAPAHADAKPIRIKHSDAAFVLRPHTTRTYSMRVKALGQKANVLEPCWGAEILGPGLDYPFGEADFLSADAPLSPAVPMNFLAGLQCQHIHWNWYDDRGRLASLPDWGPGRRAAIRKRLARRLADAPVRAWAGMRSDGRRMTMYVRVRTGALTGRTVLRLHARVYLQD